MALENGGAFQRFVDRLIQDDHALVVDVELQRPPTGQDVHFGITTAVSNYTSRSFSSVEDALVSVDLRLRRERFKEKFVPPIIAFGSMFLGMYVYSQHFKDSPEVSLLTSFIILAGLETSIKRYRKFQKEVFVLEAMEKSISDDINGKDLIGEEF